MAGQDAVVLGGGPAGLATALMLARSGMQVLVVERDRPEPAGSDPFLWERKGVPHFGQPHMLIPRACKELRECLPDVYAGLLAAGAGEIDLRARLQGTEAPGDDDLRYLAVRRQVLEAGLLGAAHAEPRVRLRFSCDVTGVLLEDERISGVRTSEGHLHSRVVIDAMGRRSPTWGWLADGGRPVPTIESSPCGVVYYSRYYRVRPGRCLPVGPWLLGPRGDLGYLGFATFPGDSQTFAVLLSVPTHAPELRELRRQERFDAAGARIPQLMLWLDPELVEPLTEVRAMAGMTNTVELDGVRPPGLFAVGDALSHTDPTLAHGIAFALLHSRELATALQRHADLAAAQGAFRDATSGLIRERYDLATAVGAERYRAWTGGGLDVAHRGGDYASFSVVAAGAAALVDPDVLRVFVRRVGLLDSTSVLDGDVAMQERIERIFGSLMTAPRPAGPTKDELLQIG